MALKDLFKKAQFSTVKPNVKQSDAEVPDGMFEKCPKCQQPIYAEKLAANFNICPECNHHNRISAKKRLEIILDSGSFESMFSNLSTLNPLGFVGYEKKIADCQEKTGLDEAVICGVGKINNKKTAIAVMDSNFMMGSMGSVVGEKITRITEYAAEKKLPLVIFTCSGGARMHEGIMSLMQMAKVSAALSRFSDCNLPYFVVLTDPTTGGVTASFAMLGDIIIAEPNAVVGFAGRRVIEGTIGTKLPNNFQTSEFLQEHGFVDIIADRRDIRDLLDKLLVFHNVSEEGKV